MYPLVQRANDVQIASKYSPSYLDGKDAWAEVMRSTPTLRVWAQARSREAVIGWLAVQINDLNEYCGKRFGMTQEQMRELANVIADGYPLMTLTELLVFFRRFKQAEYGEFFGNIDPMRITSGLKMYKDELNDMRKRWYDEEERQRMERVRNQKGVTFAQYQAMKKSKTS